MEDLPPPLYEKFLQELYSKDVPEEVRENNKKYIRDHVSDLTKVEKEQNGLARRHKS